MFLEITVANTLSFIFLRKQANVNNYVRILFPLLEKGVRMEVHEGKEIIIATVIYFCIVFGYLLRWLPIVLQKLLTSCFICTIQDTVFGTKG